MTKFVTAVDIRKADRIFAIYPNRETDQLWGQDVLSRISPAGTAAHRPYHLEIAIPKTNEERYRLMHRIRSIKGHLPLEVERRYQELAAEPQFRIALVSENNVEVGSIEFTGIEVEQPDGTFIQNYRPYRSKILAHHGIETEDLETYAPGIEAALRQRAVVSDCGPYRWQVD